MTKKRDYFSGVQEDVLRSQVHLADYNPRKLSVQAKQTLKRSIKKYGVVTGIVLNKATMTIVGGNQKIAILDEMQGYPGDDYTIKAEVVDIPNLSDEKALCVMLNSPNAQGEWDDNKMRELLPDMNYMDAGLTEEDLSLFGMDFYAQTEEERSLAAELNGLLYNKPSGQSDKQALEQATIEQNQIVASQAQEAQYQANKERMQQVKAEVKAKAAEKALEAESYVMLSFDNVTNKELFMSSFGFIETDKVIKGELLLNKLK
jgi:hypothetical protein